MTYPLRLDYLTWRPVSYRADSGLFRATPLGMLVHVVVGNGSPFNTFEGAPAGNRKFSHGWIAKDGSGEQYAELNRISWAQVDGNGTYWSWETEGFPGEPLTGPQIRTLARIHNDLGVADQLAEAPGQVGEGTHYMGGQSFGGHSCPGPGPRAAQRIDIIHAAQALRTPTPSPTPSPTSPPEEAFKVTKVYTSSARPQGWIVVYPDGYYKLVPQGVSAATYAAIGVPVTEVPGAVWDGIRALYRLAAA